MVAIYALLVNQFILTLLFCSVYLNSALSWSYATVLCILPSGVSDVLPLVTFFLTLLILCTTSELRLLFHLAMI